jgi:hypothetical protein
MNPTRFCSVEQDAQVFVFGMISRRMAGIGLPQELQLRIRNLCKLLLDGATFNVLFASMVSTPLLCNSLAPTKGTAHGGIVAANGRAFPLCFNINCVKDSLWHEQSVSQKWWMSSASKKKRGRTSSYP